MKAVLATLALILTPCLSVHGQESAAFKTHLLTYAPAGMPEAFTAFYRNSEMFGQFNASAGNLGTPVLYTGSQKFVIRSSKEEFDLPEEQLKAIPPLASITLPPKADIVLLLCIPDKSGKPRLVAYDVSSDSLPRGSYRVFNFSSKPLSIILGDQRFAVSPKSDKFVNDPAWNKDTRVLTLQIATITDNTAKLVYSNFWEHYPQRRSLLFLFNGHSISDPVIFSSFDVVSPPTADATP